MRHEETITADEMQDIVQDVIDRLLYLDADKLAMFRTFLEKTNEVFPINMTKKDGVRIYGLINKN
jgi:hypothetical protein